MWVAGGAFGLSAVFLVVGPLRSRALASPTDVATEDVRKGPFVREATATGALKAVDATPVVVPVEAEGPQKIAWLAKDGARVKAGEPVVLFDSLEMEKTLVNGQADRSTASNKIARLRADGHRTLSGLDLDLGLVEWQLTEANAFASKDPEIFSRNEIIESEIDRDLLVERRDATDFKRSETRKLTDADVALGDIEKSKADILIRQAEKGLGALRITAPHDGLLVFERNWRGETISLGDTVFPGQKIAEIPDLSTLEAKVYVLEADAGGLKPGIPTRLVLEGQTDREYRATVSRVDAMAKTRHWRVPTKYFETILALEETDKAAMKPGQAVKATIRIEEIPDALTVARGAVLDKDGKRVVYRLEDGRFVPVEVTLGRGSVSRVIVEKGLEAGDRIALRDPSHAAADLLKRPPGGSGGGGGGAAGGGR